MKSGILGFGGPQSGWFFVQFGWSSYWLASLIASSVS